ncbi:hypothetical protein [Corynebacterium striatum]|uniref:hypothetical protein n=1 Tax=Corynebacterium striatum TaxID=43770 RepID=UPI00234C5149|nr:hypothetical protein [Corynebacterium striatum]MDC7105476.1 hypothetical protein [Corynebacterium striatum]HCT3315554.1 hypothetical protein [Corynebacterium striatum]
MKAQAKTKKLMPLALAISTLALSACQPETGVGGDPDSALKANATPAPSSSSAGKPAGKLAQVDADVVDLAAHGDTIAARTKAELLVGSQKDFLGGSPKKVAIDDRCGDLSSSEQGFVLACGDKVLLIDPAKPEAPEEVAMEEETPVTVATQLSSGELFVGSHESNAVGIYVDGKRDREIKVEEGSDQLLAVPNLDGTDNVVRILRADSTIQSIDWEKDRAGGRLRAGQGIGQIAVGEGAIVLGSDTSGKRLAVYTADDVIRLHQYGNVDGTPWAVAWDPARKLAWVTTTDTGKAHAFSIESGVPVAKGSVDTVADAQNIAVLDDATLVTASATGDGIQFISDPDVK